MQREIGTLLDTILLSLYDCNGFLRIFVSSVFPRMNYLPLELLVNQISGQPIYRDLLKMLYRAPHHLMAEAAKVGLLRTSLSWPQRVFLTKLHANTMAFESAGDPDPSVTFPTL